MKDIKNMKTNLPKAMDFDWKTERKDLPKNMKGNYIVLFNNFRDNKEMYVPATFIKETLNGINYDRWNLFTFYTIYVNWKPNNQDGQVLAWSKMII